MSKRILTGIKPTGTIHIGNYFGTFEPALRTSDEYDEAFWFVANYHALNQIQDSEVLGHNTLSTAAAWLAFGLKTDDNNFLYTQSDIPEIFEITTILTSFTPKGWMNKAHAYKAAADANNEAGNPVDDGVSMGLYTYPILMAADILAPSANVVPVGKDQVQHVELARDMAQRINSHYGKDVFTLPEHRVEEHVGTIIGTDGRKMSKSYDNVIPVFATPEDRQKTINQIVTDSSAPEDNKEFTGTTLHSLFELVSDEEQLAEVTAKLEGGQMGWGDAKKLLGEYMESYFGSMSAEYFRLMDNPDEIRAILREGAEKVRPIATENLANLRESMGII